ncbi:MAG: hypothetical protein A2096_15730 [Spirochaetes bacterium GWF1_41_5]|nr:MAG: hypothetical protein A2096_15730 [Spirochaetes bacterium GWF1_41_5]HBE01534.1 hypothetical protein [Spirochaetia bacterium]
MKKTVLLLFLAGIYAETTGLGTSEIPLIPRSARQDALHPAIAVLFGKEAGDHTINPAYISPDQKKAFIISHIMPQIMGNINDIETSLFIESTAVDIPINRYLAVGASALLSFLSKPSYNEIAEADGTYSENNMCFSSAVRFTPMPREQTNKNFRMPLSLGGSASLYVSSVDRNRAYAALFSAGAGLNILRYIEIALSLRNAGTRLTYGSYKQASPFAIDFGFAYTLDKIPPLPIIIGFGLEYTYGLPLMMALGLDASLNFKTGKQMFFQKFGFSLGYTIDGKGEQPGNVSLHPWLLVKIKKTDLRISYTFRFRQHAGYNNTASLELRY